MVARARIPLPIEVGITRAHLKGHSEWSVEGVPATKPGNFAGFNTVESPPLLWYSLGFHDAFRCAVLPTMNYARGLTVPQAAAFEAHDVG